MISFFKDIENVIQKAVINDFQRIMEEIGKESVYSIALVTDSDCITLYLAVNTYEYMKKKDAEYEILYKDMYSKRQVEMLKNDSLCITKWIPSEWGYSDGNKSELNKLSKLLYTKRASLSSEKLQEYTNSFFETVTSAFQKLIEQNIFHAYSDEITYFISISDDARTPSVENFSAKILNSEQNYAKFLKRTEGWGF
jgi:hypothetical protein